MISWLKKRRRRKFLEELAWEFRDPKSDASIRVTEKANILSQVLMMHWLDTKRIRHCAMCPSTATLRYVLDKYLCPGHVGIIKAHD